MVEGQSGLHRACCSLSSTDPGPRVSGAHPTRQLDKYVKIFLKANNNNNKKRTTTKARRGHEGAGAGEGPLHGRRGLRSLPALLGPQASRLITSLRPLEALVRSGAGELEPSLFEGAGLGNSCRLQVTGPLGGIRSWGWPPSVPLQTGRKLPG